MKISGNKDELIRIRRDIHAHPEPGRKEFRTSALVAEKLKELEVRTNVAETGVVATLRGKYPGKTILLRQIWTAFDNRKTTLSTNHRIRIYACLRS